MERRHTRDLSKGEDVFLVSVDLYYRMFDGGGGLERRIVFELGWMDRRWA